MMTRTEVAKRFANSLALHEVLCDADSEDYAAPPDPDDVFSAAVNALRVQAADRVENDVENLLVAPGRGRDVLAREENIALLLALFIVGRDATDGAEACNGHIVIGDHENGLSSLRIEVAARRSDFDIEFLLTWREEGPHPEWYPGAGDDVPHSLHVTKQMALIRDQAGSGEPSRSDRKTRRGGLSSLGLLVMSYEDGEAGRDPFGLAKRALSDLERAANEDFTP
jgi:hypothetical protein